MMQDCIAEFRSIVQEAARTLGTWSEERAGQPLSPGKWSPKQVLGHLIDSASNNHQRFVRTQFQDDLRFPGYEQNAWVDRQAYATAPWGELVALWQSFNLHLARVMEAADAEALRKPRSDHNCDRIAWERFPVEEPVTLEYFMRDYVGHLQHHLRQISPELAPEPRMQRS